MSRSSLICALAPLALTLAACTPVGDHWPSTEELDRRWVATADPTPAPLESTACPTEPTPQPPAPLPCNGAPPAPTAPLHPALTLDLRRDDTPPILEPGEHIDLSARLRNRSLTVSHRAVLPGDGSEVAWREPHVWYSGFVDTGDGCWSPIPELTVARCGLFDHEWQDDIVELSPGETKDLEWLGNPAYMLDIQQPGRVRLYLHYAFREGEVGKGESSEAPELGSMKGIDAFELVSNPIELTLSRPLDLVLTAKPRPAGSEVYRVVDAVTLRLRNVAATDGEILPPSSSRLRFEVEGTEKSWPSATWRPEDDEQPPQTLAAGAGIDLLGSASPNPALFYEWHHTIAENVRIRAAYRPYEDRPSVELRSSWVEIDLR